MEFSTDARALATLIAAIIAAITSITIAILTVRSQQKQSKLQKQLKFVENQLDKEKELSEFVRNRVANHFDRLAQAFVDISTIANLIILRVWLFAEKDLETETKFSRAYSELEYHFGGLESSDTIDENLITAFNKAKLELFNKWIMIMGQAHMRDESYKRDRPDVTQFDEDRYSKIWKSFKSEVESMRKVIKSISKEMRFPE